jgi:hypothetical protein
VCGQAVKTEHSPRTQGHALCAKVTRRLGKYKCTGTPSAAGKCVFKVWQSTTHEEYQVQTVSVRAANRLYNNKE